MCVCVKGFTYSKCEFCLNLLNNFLYKLNSTNPTVGLRVDIK